MQGIPWASASVAAGIIGKTSVLIAVPLFHQYGEYAMESAIHWAQTVLLIADPRDTDSIIKYLKEFRPAHTCVVPTQLMRIAESKIGRMPVGITSAAAPLPKETAEAIKADTKMPVGEAYGLNRSGPGYSHESFNRSSADRIYAGGERGHRGTHCRYGVQDS